MFEVPRPNVNAEPPDGEARRLVEKMLRNSGRTVDVVANAFLGSGSTLIAAEQLSRRRFEIELDPRYVDVVVRRWEQFTGKTAVLA